MYISALIEQGLKRHQKSHKDLNVQCSSVECFQETSVSDIPQAVDDEGFPDRVTEAGPDNLEVEKATDASLLTPDSADGKSVHRDL